MNDLMNQSSKTETLNSQDTIEYSIARKSKINQTRKMISVLSLCISFLLLAFYFTLHLYHKNTKNIILSYLSDLTLVSDRVGIDNPLSRWLRGFICLRRCEGLVRGLLFD